MRAWVYANTYMVRNKPSPVPPLFTEGALHKQGKREHAGLMGQTQITCIRTC